MTCFCCIGDAALTAVLPLELDLILLGYSDGYVRQASCSALLSRYTKLLFEAQSRISISSSIRSLHFIRNESTGDAFIVGGSDDGGIAIWSLRDLELCARYIHFIVPLCHVAQVWSQAGNAGPLYGCALFISGDGTIAVITLDGFQFLCIIPGSASPLSCVYYGGGMDNEQTMTIYADGSARLWDMKAREFRRAMDREKAKESLGRSVWQEIVLDDEASQLSTSFSEVLNRSTGTHRTTCIMPIALQQFVRFTATDVKAFSNAPSYIPKRSLQSTPAPQLRALLCVLLTPTLSPEIDEICARKLAILPSCKQMNRSHSQSDSVCCPSDPRDAWCISSITTASRAMAIVAVLKALSLYEAVHDDCQTVITFYATSLASLVGQHYKPPDLVWLARRWFETMNEVRQAAKILVDTGVVRLSDGESISMVDAWQRHLPCSEGSDKDPKKSALALFLCGYVAVEKQALLSDRQVVYVLMNIANSIASYLHEEDPTCRVLAVDLCARGFRMWQQHVDAMAVLRALFGLAVSSRKDNISIQNVGQYARQAVLQIALTDTMLFMTTLTLDILNPKSLEHRKNVMQLVTFLIRKKPLLLYPNLPRLMEAVVKSLDPNSTSSRDAVHDIATEVIGHVVKTFPTVDFHMASQRLAVGTCEGAVIMYDLKTATQLYVLEGHKKRPAACTFSPDGRRLVTVSLEEGVVLVWKVGSSFTSFFNPGAPPRQGHSGSQPYKTLSFNVGDEANMTVAETLEWVKFEWASERSVRLHIRESTLTFST
ncbi:WD40-repeat-containing domain protein [Scleroderma citrinum]